MIDNEVFGNQARDKFLNLKLKEETIGRKEADEILADQISTKQGKLIPGNNITISKNNTISATASPLEPATESILGGIKVGSNLSITTDGTLSAKAQEIDVDDSLSTTSKNPVQNKIITTELNKKQETLVAGDNISISENNVISSTGGIITTELDSTTENIDYIFIDSVDKTYSKKILSASLAIGSDIQQGFLSCINISKISTNVDIPVTNNSPYPLMLVVNNAVQNTSIITTYPKNQTTRKSIFCYCDGVNVEVTVMDEIKYN